MQKSLGRASRFARTSRALGVCGSVLAVACGSTGELDGPADAVRASPAPAAAPASSAPAAAAPSAAANVAAGKDGANGAGTPAASSAALPSATPAQNGAPAPGGAAATTSPAARHCDSLLTFDDLYARLDADLLVQDSGDRPFLRYVSLANRLNQGVCPEDLEDDRAALIKALNSLSTESTITVPEAIDSDRVIYRIDVRDFGWDQPATVDGVSFTDKWEAIVAASPFAVEFSGDQADQVKLQTTTKVPLLFSDALLDEATVGNLYYALIGIGATEDELLAQLGIDEEAQEDQKIVIRAGTSHSILSPQDVVAERLEVEAFQGYYWSRYDLASSTGGQSIFANPLGFQEDSIAAVFSLRNGLNGYALFDAAGTRLTDTDVLVDATEPDREAENSVSCSQCHAAGLNPITDEVRAFAQANSRQFDSDTFGEILDSFPVQSELDATIQRDSALYASALARAGLKPSGVDPIHTAYARFDGDVTLAVAAAELGVRADDLSHDLLLLSSRVDAKLSVLATGRLSREDFEELYLPTLCAVQISNENQPDAAACAAVGQ